MKYKTYLLLSCSFLLAAGVIFTIERLGAYIYWNGRVFTGKYPKSPEMSSAFQNFFLWLFLAESAGLFTAFIIKRKDDSKP
ncbi:hypothetical protein [Halobacillus sp. A5]|uniref:hypothetical protein n=1 Tax=Halobacillus sp. A5 TaxID=2880263 RepID=UPI0020A635B1|nr:hypothetical protein [Halobacillus sp. A5]MCP3028819.1 hypothetical protein [Halobacillus sp. A5]